MRIGTSAAVQLQCRMDLMQFTLAGENVNRGTPINLIQIVNTFTTLRTVILTDTYTKNKLHRLL